MKSSTQNTLFWKNKIDLLYWHKKPKNIFKTFKNKFKWYEDGRLNIFYNCVTKNILNNLSNKKALIFFDKNKNEQTLNYLELYNLVRQFCDSIKKLNLLKNKYVAIHGNASIDTSVSMLSCARLGLPHAVFFDDLQISAIEIRINLIKPQVFITRCDDKDFFEKIVPLIKKFKNIRFIHLRKNNFTKKNFYQININDFDLKKYKVADIITDKIQYFRSNKVLFSIFTSGSTGIPKCVEHSSGGYLTFVKFSCINKFGLNENDIFLVGSDAGWINGHSYSLYGPLSIGATSVLVEKPFQLLDIKFTKYILKKSKVSILYLPVTLIRLVKSIANIKKIKSNYLKTIGSMGEPLSQAVGKWYSNFFNLKKKAIINTYFQTETGGILFSPSYKDKKKNTPHGSVGGPICKTLIKKKFNKRKFEIKINNSWPGCMINILNGKKIYDKYWDKDLNFKMFDEGYYDLKKNLYVIGRSDDVINIRGHRVGSAEIESVLLINKNIVEVAAVGSKDELEGNVLNIFIVSKFNKKIPEKKINTELLQKFGSYCVPKNIYFVKDLPKTKSGKILRRSLKEMLEGKKIDQLGDFTTIINKKTITDVYELINSNL